MVHIKTIKGLVHLYNGAPTNMNDALNSYITWDFIIVK